MNPDDPRHGTKTGHVAGCREECCRRANTLYQNLWRMGRTNKAIDGTGTRRRVQALQALGWTFKDIAEASGIPAGSVQCLCRSNRAGTLVWKTTAEGIERAYAKLSMTLGSSGQTRTRAAVKGWVVPLAWDDNLIDNPTATPRGVASSSTTRFDPEAVSDLLDQGYSRAGICHRLGYAESSLQIMLQRAGRVDVWRRAVQLDRKSA